MAAKQGTKQTTLGLLGTGLVTGMQNQLWQGAMKAAQEHNARLVYYPTISLSSSPPFDPHTKVLFDLVDSKYTDGLLIWYAGIVEGVGITQSKYFFDRYADLPIVTIGSELEKYPNLSIDNYQGVRAAIEHLIEVHGRQNIAVIRGPVGHPDADERYRSYVETLHAYNLHPNPDFIAEALFELQTAANEADAAIRRWFQSSDRKPDAVVTASDYMALAAIKAIEARGLRVPEDVAVVGFDDVADGQASAPPLTTVRQPFYELGYQATEELLALLNGRSVLPHVLIPAHLIVRESCGCAAKSLSLSTIINMGSSERIQDTTNSPLDELPDDLMIMVRDLDIPINQLKDLVNILRRDLKSTTSPQFLFVLRQYLIQSLALDFDTMAWQSAISALRNYALSLSGGTLSLEIETLFDQARVLVTEIHQRAHVRQRLEVDQQIEQLRRTSEALITSFGSQLLANTLYDRLPELGFRNFYLSLYDDPQRPETSSHLIIAYENGHRYDLLPEGLRFPTPQLIPESLPSSRLATPIVVEPLYFGDDQLGILVLEAGPTEGAVYESIRAQVSSALQGSRLLRQIQDHAAQLERRVTERTEDLTQTVAQLQREVIERQQAEAEIHRLNDELEQRVVERTAQLRASNLELESFAYVVSHDLKAPLRGITQLASWLGTDYADAFDDNGHQMLDLLTKRTQRMHDLIDGILQYSRIGRVKEQKDRIDLNQLVQDIIDGIAPPSHIKVSVDTILPTVIGDRTRVEQVFQNLIGNSIKFMDKDEGWVRIGCEKEAQQWCFNVSDNGPGIDAKYHEKIFQIFQTLISFNKAEGTGIGLALVRKIVERWGGQVWVESTVGQGSTFFFTLPETEGNDAGKQDHSFG